MARKMTEWPSKRGPITKIMPSDGCIGDTVPWRWESGTISTNLDGIWGMSGSACAPRRVSQESVDAAPILERIAITLTDISQVSSNFVEIVPRSQRQGNGISFDAIR